MQTIKIIGTLGYPDFCERCAEWISGVGKLAIIKVSDAPHELHHVCFKHLCEHHIKMTVRGGWMCMNCPANENLSRSDRVNLNAIKEEIPDTRQWMLKGNDLDAAMQQAKKEVESWPEWKRCL